MCMRTTRIEDSIRSDLRKLRVSNWEISKKEESGRRQVSSLVTKRKADEMKNKVVSIRAQEHLLRPLPSKTSAGHPYMGF